MKSPQSPFEETSPYLQGRRAFQMGVSFYACPYEAGEERRDWEWGHSDAEDEAEEEAQRAAQEAEADAQEDAR